MKKHLILAVLLIIALTVPALGAMDIIMTQRQALVSGTWTLANSATNKYSTEYRYTTTASGGTKYAQFTPTIPVTANDWKVYAWYPTVSSQTSSVRYTIHTASGDTNVSKSQQTGQGTWVLIGTYTFAAGTGNYIRVTNYGTTGGNAAVDAIRLTSAKATDLTTPTVSDITSVPGAGSVAINWTTDEPTTSQVEYGTTASYGAMTAVDAKLVTNHSVIVTGLTCSSLYHFRVKSSDAASNMVTSGDSTFTTLAANTPELRGSWLFTWGDSMLSAAQITEAVDTLYAANYNVVIPEIRKAGDAYYDSAYEPRANNIIDPLPFDPLADIIEKAHAKSMEVQAWFVTYRIWSTNGLGTAPANHIWSQHPEYAMKSNTGSIADGAHYNLDPGVPAVQDYISRVIIDLISKYDLDGINWDYVRYPGELWGYNEITVERFRQDYGVYPPTAKPAIGSADYPTWQAWCDFRRQQVTDLVKKTYMEVMWRKPHIKMCVDTIGWSGADPNTDYTQTSQYASVFQNAKGWMEQHIVDANRLMNYKRDYDFAQGADFRVWNRFLKTMQDTTGRHSICGPGVYLNYTPDSITQLAQARSEGLAGLCTYAYHATNISGDSNAAFYNTVHTQLFPEPAPIPEMPWKTNPTTGIVFGNVSDASMPNDPIYQNWVYKATATLTGPYPSTAAQTTLTDATGTFGFIDVAPGVYSVTISKPGFMTRTYANQMVEAGDVIREDFNLGYITATSPTGAVGAGWNTFSLPYEPVNAAPASVLAGANINNRLFRWDNPTQSQERYVTGEPGFGNMTMGDGYVLTLSAPYTISYQAYGGSPAMRDISLPTTGFAIIGCPMDREVVWENVMVTKDAETVTLREAAKTRNWLSSVGFWWNSADQSQYDIGLPEDNCGSTSMLPWHAYELNTFTNGLTLTLK